MQVQNTPIVRGLRRKLHDLVSLEVSKRQLLQSVSGVFWQAILRDGARHGNERATHDVHGGQRLPLVQGSVDVRHANGAGGGRRL